MENGEWTNILVRNFSKGVFLQKCKDTSEYRIENKKIPFTILDSQNFILNIMPFALRIENGEWRMDKHFSFLF
jgi:ABC-type polysaccharide/polyol phosphate transport system ATPase subunit